MMKKNLLLSLLFLLWSVLPPVYAQTYPADFLTFGTSARPLGMGNAFTALADEASTATYNPAGLAQLTHHEIHFMHATVAHLTAYDVASYIYPFSPKITFGISWLRVGVPDIPVTAVPVTSKAIGPNNRPYVANTFQDTSHAIFLSGGCQLLTFPKDITLQLGASLKLIYLDAYLNTNAVGAGSDIGVLVKTNPKNPTALSFGCVATDFFTTKLYWNTPPAHKWEAPHTETILPHFKAGVAYHQKLPIFKSLLTLAADLDTQNNYELDIGAEYVLFDLLALRCGIEGRNGTDRTFHFTAGTGIRLQFVTGAAFSVDYAYQRQNDFGINNRLSLRIRF